MNEQPKMHTVQELDEEIERFDLARMPHGAALSAQELYVLEKAGYEICNVVIGNIVYSMGIQGILKSFRRAFRRGEMVEFSRMNLDARNIARNRMLEAAKSIGATHVAGIVFETQEYADFLEITAIGTALKKVRGLDDGIAIGS